MSEEPRPDDFELKENDDAVEVFHGDMPGTLRVFVWRRGESLYGCRL